MKIRAGSPQDYPEIVRVSNLAMPEYELTIELLKSYDTTRAAKCKAGYFVTEDDGTIVGFSRYMQFADVYHPQVFYVTVQVQPDHQQKGIGKQLHEALSTALAEDQPISFKSTMYDGNTGAHQFAQKFGYVEYSRRIESKLTVADCDLSEFVPRLRDFANDGVTFKSFTDFGDTTETAIQLYDVQWALELDVPLDETLTQPSLKQWRKEVIDNPMFVPSASFIAIENEQVIGLTEAFQYAEGRLYIEFTGTRPQYRRRGIATALKVHTIRWAIDNNYQAIGTTNDAVNTDMISINTKLGFVPKPARIQIEKAFDL